MTPLPKKPTLAAFRAWLEAQPEGSIVGYAQEERACPIARFIGSSADYRVWVTDHWIFIQEGGRRGHQWKQPRWATLFVDKVDNYESGRPITREEALAALREATR